MPVAAALAPGRFKKHLGAGVGARGPCLLPVRAIGRIVNIVRWQQRLRNFYRRAYGIEREAAVKLMRALVGAGYIADDQRADAAIEKVALEAGLNREQLKAALKYAREQKWVAETNKAAWSIVTQAGVDAANAE